MAVERELYFTDFENATPGDDQLHGFDNWVGAPTGSGSHGIISEAEHLVEGLDNVAFIGFGTPTGLGTTTVTILRQVAHDPITSGEPIVRFTAVVGINDSTNSALPGLEPPRDHFFVTIINSAGSRLASLDFNNTETGFGLWRGDGIDSHDTTEAFVRNEIHILFAEIDFANNTWTVELDGFPIFIDAQLTAKTEVSSDLGAVGIVWQRDSLLWGNNWMLLDDWTLSADTIKLVIPENPFDVKSVALDPTNQPVITWNGQPGFTYQISYSENAIDWFSDLPASFFTPTQTSAISYTDTTNTGEAQRLYRVTRTPG